MNRSIKKIDASEYLSVLQFNTLADCCSDNSDYGFPYVDSNVLEWSSRAHALEREIFRHDPDIIALEEIDKPDFFSMLLKKRGYKSCYFKSPLSKHGIITAWKISKFHILDNLHLQYKRSDNSLSSQIASMVNLRFLGNEWTLNISFVATHLKSKPEFRDERCYQVKQLKEWIENHKAGCLIIAGDFNDTPDSGLSNMLPGMKDACSKHMEFTTFKTRPNKDNVPTEVKRIIDYIYYEENTFTPVELLGCPPHVHKPGLPSVVYPSDHLSLWVKLRIF